MKINMGCGRTVLEGWYNVDIIPNPMAKRQLDLVSDIKKLPMLADGCADEIMAIHVFEHFYRWECDDVIVEWKRLLKPFGRLVLEMPDLLKCCRNILEHKAGRKEPDQLGMWGLFGDWTHKDPLMMHKHGWTFTTIEPFLTAHGFYQVVERRTEYHQVGRDVRDFRVEALKQGIAQN